MYDLIRAKLASGKPIILDGGTGTDIQRRGVPMSNSTWCADANLTHPEVVRELLKTRIAVDHVNRLGWTALLETVILTDGGPTHQDILAQLIAAGADLNLKDGEGISPLIHAKQRGYAAMVKMLAAAGAS